MLNLFFGIKNGRGIKSKNRGHSFQERSHKCAGWKRQKRQSQYSFTKYFNAIKRIC